MAVVSTITLPDETIFIIRDPNAMSKNGGTFSGRVYALTPISDNEIATKGYVDAIVATIEGGGSSLIFTQEEKTKLAGIAAGAQVNVQADWNAISGDAKILNKPTSLSGYGIGDAYTKNQINNLLNQKENLLSNAPTVTSLRSSDYLFLERNGQIYKILASQVNISGGDDSQEDMYSITTENGDSLLTESGDLILFD